MDVVTSQNGNKLLSAGSGESGESTEGRIRRVFNLVFAGRRITPPPISAETVLDTSLGLESLDFAEIVLRLEEEFGFDPFANGIPPHVRTFGDLPPLYSPSGVAAS